MIITPSSLDSTFVGFNTSFQQGFNAVQPMASMLATSVPSSGESNVYAWLGKLLRMRKWIGPRQLQNISARSYTLANELFEMSLAVPRAKIADDQLGTFGPLFQEMGQQTALWMDDLLVKALQLGNTSSALGWDGKNFFATDHPIDLDGRTSGSNANILTAAALNETTVDAARVALANFKGEDGRPLGTKLTHILVPPALELAARKVVQAEYLASGATNVMNQAAQIIVLPQLSDTTNDAAALTSWYALDLSRVIKPLVSQVREAPDFVSRTDPASDPKFNRDEYEFGSQARGAAGYGLYFTAIRNSTAGT